MAIVSRLFVFFILMSGAIVSMTFVMRARGVSSSLATVPIMGASILISATLLVVTLRSCDATKSQKIVQ